MVLEAQGLLDCVHALALAIRAMPPVQKWMRLRYLFSAVHLLVVRRNRNQDRERSTHVVLEEPSRCGGRLCCC